MRHGELPVSEHDLAAPPDDPELALVFADQHTWMLAHPCNCEALCECESTNGGKYPEEKV